MRATFILTATAIILIGCKDPGAKVAPAAVEAPAQEKAEPTTAAAPIASLAVNPSNSKIEFVGAKVTASHDGGFTDFSGKVDLAEPVRIVAPQR